MKKKNIIKIKNKSTNQIITSGNLTICNTFILRMFGLMFTKKIGDRILLFKFNKNYTWSFHMFFVFYPITIIFLDSSYKIVDINYNFKPFKTYTSNHNSIYVLEFSTILSHKDLSIGDTIELISNK